MRAFAFIGEHGYACEIVDLSYRGCRIVTFTDDVLTGLVDLCVPGQPVHKAAEILWRRRKEYGLKFTLEVAEGEHTRELI